MGVQNSLKNSQTPLASRRAALSAAPSGSTASHPPTATNSRINSFFMSMFPSTTGPEIECLKLINQPSKSARESQEEWVFAVRSLEQLNSADGLDEFLVPSGTAGETVRRIQSRSRAATGPTRLIVLARRRCEYSSRASLAFLHSSWPRAWHAPMRALAVRSQRPGDWSSSDRGACRSSARPRPGHRNHYPL